MSDIRHILLIPTEGDPHGLLKEGPCGARPPMAWYCDDYQAWEQWHRGMDHAEPCAWAATVERARCALVLAWDGEPVADGLLRIMLKEDTAVLKRWMRGMLKGQRSPTSALGTLVLDAEGREVTP